MKKLIFFSAVLTLTACGTFPIAIMQNPKTGETVKCEPGEYYRGYEPWAYQGQLDNCVAGYEKAGFVRVDDSPAQKKTAGK